MVTSILVGLDDSEYGEAAVALGIDWATRFDCLLVGIGVIDEPTIRGPGAPERISPSYRAAYDQLVSDATHRVDRTLENFTLRCTEAGVSSKQLEDVGSPCEQIMLEAQRYDMIVVGQKTFFRSGVYSNQCNTVDTLLHTTPRPIVVVPKEYRTGTGGILIAFDGSLQASRALYAFVASGLATLGPVHVLCTHETSVVEARKIAERAVEYLRFHDITASPHAITDTCNVSDRILETAKHLDVELIVMGAYGRNTLTEFFLGSVTRSVLETTDLPTFLFH